MPTPMKVLKSLFAVLILVICVPTFAQESEEEKTEQEAPAKKKFERVEVTGSLIRRSDFEGPSPVEVIDRKALDETSYNSVADYVRDLPISSFGSAKESSGSTAAGVSTINLRGLGAENTLVLLNGARLPIDGNAGAVNMNLLPEIIVDGVEILKDGASATYGSDAIGGVVAIKSRKNFTGTEVSIKHTQPEEPGGQRSDIGILHGKQFGAFGPFTGGSITAAAQYRFNTRIFDRDRSWSEPDDVGIRGWSRFGPIPNYIDDAGNFRTIESQCNNSPFSDTIVEVDGGSSFCRFPFATRSTSLPEIQQLSGYANVELEMGTRNRISVTAMATRQETEWIFAPAVGTPSAGFVIPALQAGTIFNGGPLPGTSGASDVPFTYRTAILGDRVTQTSNDSYYVYSEYSREFGDTWEWKTSAAYSSADKNARNPRGYALRSLLAAEVAAGNFNPFDTNDDGSALLNARFQPFQKTNSNSVVADSRVNGEIVTLGQNSVLAGAFGVQYIHSEFRDVVDPDTASGNVFGSAGSNGGGQRDVLAAYTEYGLNIGRMWDFQAAGRFDRFSDFGTAFSPKLGVKFRPFDSLMFRASFGKAFKAPSLLDLHASDSIGNPSFIDTVRCNDDIVAGRGRDTTACRENQYEVRSGGNPGLEEERATSYGAGFIYEPVKGLAIGSDYWLVDQTNLVGVDYEDLTQAELDGADLSEFGVTVTRDASNNLVSITAPLLNLASRKQSGLDINVSYTWKTKFGRFRISDSHSQTFERSFSGFPGVASRDRLDDYEFPEWRNNASLLFSPNKKHAFTLSYNSVAGQKTVNRQDRIPDYGELNFSYTTQLEFIKGTTLTAGVNNILGKTPPFDPQGGATPFNQNIYSQLQRNAFVNIRHAF